MNNNMNFIVDDAIAKAFNDSDKITQVIQEGIYAALLKHKQAGNPICEWRNGKVHWITPDKILVAQKDVR